MIPRANFDGVIWDQNYRFRLENWERLVRLVGIIFCRPESKLTQSVIVPSLSYFHFRSGNNIAFYFAGYDDDEVIRDPYTTVTGPNKETWFFSPISFDEFRREVEGKTKWHYSGGCDLILTNAQVKPGEKEVSLDFSSSIMLNLENLPDIPSLSTVGELFEKIFQYAENQDPIDPTSDFSDWAALSIGKDSFWNFIISWLPKALQTDARGAIELAVTDITF